MRWDEWRGSLDGRPTMWIKRLISWRGFRLDLHKMVDADDVGCFHTHPAKAIRLILFGGYIEELHNGDLEPQVFKFWLPSQAGVVRPETCHRIAALINDTSLSLWLRWPKTAQVELRGLGWPKDWGKTDEDQ